MSFEDYTTERHERRITRYKSTACNARIIWLKTEDGKNMPVDADTVEPAHERYDAKSGHVSHWATCKSVKQFRAQQ